MILRKTLFDYLTTTAMDSMDFKMQMYSKMVYFSTTRCDA